MGFEPTRANTLRPKHSALDHSAIQSIDNIQKYSLVHKASTKFLSSIFLFWAPFASMMEMWPVGKETIYNNNEAGHTDSQKVTLHQCDSKLESEETLD